GAGRRQRRAHAVTRPGARVDGQGCSGRAAQTVGSWPMKVGFVGLGAMGLPMTRNLLATGHEVPVTSRSRGPIDTAVGEGASDGGDAAGVAKASELIVLCVPNSPEVVDVLDAMLPALGPGKIVGDCPTIDPDVER